MSQETQEYLKWAFEHVEENYEELVVITGRVMKNSSDERIPDAISYIMLHNLPNMLRTWDPSIGELDTHVNRSWRWYVWKYLKRADVRREREQLLMDSHTLQASYIAHNITEDKELIDILTAHLHPHHWMLLRKAYIEQCTIAEIANHTHLSRGTVKSRLNQAINHAQDILKLPPEI